MGKRKNCSITMDQATYEYLLVQSAQETLKTLKHVTISELIQRAVKQVYPLLSKSAKTDQDKNKPAPAAPVAVKATKLPGFE